MVAPTESGEGLGSGCDAIDVAATVLRAFPKTAIATLVEIEVPPIAQNRLTKKTQLESLVPSALKLREDYGVPFWMAIMFVASKQGMELPRELLQAASLHQPITSAKLEQVRIGTISTDFLRTRAATIRSGHILALSSRVTSDDGGSAHIPMLDFRIPSSEQTLSTATQVLREFNMAGWLLDSGQSYHFYGSSILSEQELTGFLARALFFTPIVDYRWIAHQLLEHACALRLSSGSELQKVPVLAAQITPVE